MRPTSPERVRLRRATCASSRERGHNFIRLWRWEQFRSQAAGGELPPEHDAAAVGAHRAGHGEGRQAAVRPRAVRRRPSSSACASGSIAAGEAGIYVGVMLFDGWALHLEPAARPRRGPPVPRRATTSTASAPTSIDDLQVLPLDPRVAGASRRRTSARSSTPLHDLPNVLWEVANESSGDGSVDRGVRRVPGHGRGAGLGRLDRVAVLGHRRRQAARGGARLRPAPDRDDDAVPGRASRPRSTSRCSAVAPSGSRPATTTRSSPTAGTRWRPGRRRPLVRRPARRRRPKVVISDTDHYAPGQATRCGPGSRSCAATTRS